MARLTIDPDRLAAARAAVRLMTPHVELSYDRGFFLSWADRGGAVRLKWQCRGRGDYPVWYHRRPAGGTWCQAVAHLVRWAAGRPTLPLRVWRHWCGPEVRVGDGVDTLLAAAGWPEEVPCVFCGRGLGPAAPLDWYHPTVGHPGPGCKPRCGPGNAAAGLG